MTEAATAMTPMIWRNTWSKKNGEISIIKLKRTFNLQYSKIKYKVCSKWEESCRNTASWRLTAGSLKTRCGFGCYFWPQTFIKEHGRKTVRLPWQHDSTLSELDLTQITHNPCNHVNNLRLVWEWPQTMAELLLTKALLCSWFWESPHRRSTITSEWDLPL